MDVVHKSNPWEATDCKREGCQFCADEKMIGKCKSVGVVYEIECMNCKREEERKEEKIELKQQIEKKL